MQRPEAKNWVSRTTHGITESLGATCGVYKGQGRNQRELMYVILKRKHHTLAPPFKAFNSTLPLNSTPYSPNPKAQIPKHWILWTLGKLP